MLLRIVLLLLLFLITVFVVAYFAQERLIFHPDKLAENFEFSFEGDFEELYLEVEDGVQLHALHFRAKNSKGLVFYVHGNAGSLEDWGVLSELYLRLGYDLLMFDYRGFGKSNGKISSQEQFFADVQAMYNYAKTLEEESRILVEGFSIGTAAASKIASENNPQQLILKAPYYSLMHLIKSKHFYLPAFILKYKFETVNLLQKVTVPTTIFHGTIDELIPHSNSELLYKTIPTINLVLIPNCLHNDIPFSEVYQKKMEELLK